MVSLCILKSYCKAHDKYTGIIKQVEIKKKEKKEKRLYRWLEPNHFFEC